MQNIVQIYSNKKQQKDCFASFGFYLKRKEGKEMAEILNGKELAKKIRKELKVEVEELKNKGINPI